MCQSESLISHYQQYLVTLNNINLALNYFLKNTLPRDYFLCETEESMNLRHKAELLDIQNAQLTQRKALLDRRQICIQNTLSLPSFPCDFNPNDHEETHKIRSHAGGVDAASFSMISSGSFETG